MRALKIILILSCVLITLVGGLLTAILIFVDPNDYKDDIIAAVKKQTGRELVIAGDMKLSVFPWLGLEMGQISLGNSPKFPNKVFAGIQRAEVRIKILPLLQKKVSIGTIILDGFQLNLEKNAQGITNWSDLAAKKDKPSLTDKSAVKKDSTNKAGDDDIPLAALAVEGIEITNGKITFRDEQAHSSTALTNVEMIVDNIAFGSPFSLFFGFDVQLTNPDLLARLTLKGQPMIDPQTGSYAVKEAALKITGTGKTLPGGSIDLSLTTDLLANLHKETLSISPLKLTSHGLTLTGEVTGQTILADPRLKGSLHLLPCNPKTLVTTLGLAPIKTTDKAALTNLKTDLTFTAGKDEAALTSLNLVLDDTTIKGTASINHFARPAIVFGIDVDAINIDRYLPPKTDKPAESKSKQTQQDTAPKATGDEPLPIPVEMLRTLNIKGKLTAGKLTVNKLHFSKTLVQLTAKNGNINVAPMATNMYEGTFDGTALLNVQGKTPRMKVTEKLSSLHIGPLLKDLTGKDSLTGTAKSSANLTTKGITVNALKANLNGNLAFDLANGAVKGINLPKMLRDAVIKLKGGTPEPDEVNQTDFASLKGTAKITNGIVDNRDLLMMSPLMRVTGAGKVDLPREGINYLVKTKVVSSLKGQKGEPLAELAGVTVPVRITGSFDKPAFKLDLGSLAKEKGMQELKDKASEHLFKGGKKGKKTNGNTGDRLKGLFN